MTARECQSSLADSNKSEGEIRMTREKIDKDVEVVVASTVRNGSFFYENRNGTVTLDLAEFGDDDYIDLASLKQLKSKSKSLLEDFTLLIVSVESETHTVEDVIKELRLTDSYEELASLIGSKGLEIDMDLVAKFINECEDDYLKKIVTNKKSKVKNLLIEEAVHLHKANEFNDHNKMNIIAGAIGKHGEEATAFWSDVKASAH